MANTSYPKGMEKLLSGQINALSDTLKVALFTDAYTYSQTHEYLSQLGPLVGTDQTLTNVTVTGGVIDADDVDFGTLAPGSTVKGFAIYRSTGNPSTSPVLFHYDSQVGLPFDTNGGALTIPWDDAIRRIARVAGPFYPKAAERLLQGMTNMATAPLKAVGIAAGYFKDPAHEFLVDVGALLGAPQTLTSRSVNNGVFDADDIDLGAIASGASLGGIVIFEDSGDPATSRLVLKPSNIGGFPMTTNGSGVSVQWSNGAAKIVSLVPA